jgi:hypothetical protein
MHFCNSLRVRTIGCLYDRIRHEMMCYDRLHGFINQRQIHCFQANSLFSDNFTKQNDEHTNKRHDHDELIKHS